MASLCLAQILAIVAVAADVQSTAAGQVAAPAAAKPDFDKYQAEQADRRAQAKKDSAEGARNEAIDKVISMLEDLQAKVMEEGEKEAASYNTFACFCKDTTADKTKAIQEGTDEKDRLTAEIGELSTSRDELDTTIAETEKAITEIEDEIKKAKEERKKELIEYEKNEADLSGAVYALEGAIKVLKASKDPSLVQLKAIAATVRNAALMADALGLDVPRKTVSFLLQQDISDVPTEVYTFHSDDVISTLEGLLTDFKAKKTEVDEAETKAVSAHEAFMQEKTDLIKTKQGELDQARKDKAEKQEQIATDSQDLSGIAAQLLSDQEYAAELATMCSDKAKTWEQRTQVRSDEIQALGTAVTIIKGVEKDDAKEDDAEDAAGLVQQAVSVGIAKQAARDPRAMSELEAETEEFEADSPAFLQKRQVRLHRAAASRPKEDGRQMVISLLKSKGKELKSNLLSALAARIAAAKDDPFAKVKILIQELIERMLAEAGNEANQKGWCDKAISDAEQKRDQAAEEIKDLNGKLMELEARVDKLTEELKVLTTEIGDLKAKRDEATKMRNEEKTENEATIKEAKEALSAVQEAIDILEKFYATAAKAEVELVQKQTPKEDAPDTGFEGAYKGAQGSAGGVIGMLEVIESDFQRTIKETETAEAEAAQDYFVFMTESGKSLAEREEGKKIKTKLKDDAEASLQSDMDSLDTNTESLQNAIKELLELQPACVDTGMSYEERVARRQEEIDALHKALCILTEYEKYGPDAASSEC